MFIFCIFWHFISYEFLLVKWYFCWYSTNAWQDDVESINRKICMNIHNSVEEKKSLITEKE